MRVCGTFAGTERYVLVMQDPALHLLPPTVERVVGKWLARRRAEQEAEQTDTVIRIQIGCRQARHHCRRYDLVIHRRRAAKKFKEVLRGILGNCRATGGKTARHHLNSAEGGVGWKAGGEIAELLERDLACQRRHEGAELPGKLGEAVVEFEPLLEYRLA